MRASDFDFALPPELIAQTPSPARDQSRLLVLQRAHHNTMHHRFSDLPSFLQAGDVLVLNDSRVIPARLRGLNPETGGAFELLLLEETSRNDWWCMVRPGKHARLGTQIVIRDLQGKDTSVRATVAEINDEGHRRLHFTLDQDIRDQLDILGEVPLPPYIRRSPSSSSSSSSGLPLLDRDRYQTVFARDPGSVAAPTAGLHFTPEILEKIRAQGVQVCFVTLHVGLGTFAPVKVETLSEHKMHEERFELSPETAGIINEAKKNGRRVIAVGTTTVRVLESLAQRNSTEPGGEANRSAQIAPGSGRTRIFIYPPFEFRIVDALLTNFHLPRSTLLMLVSAFAATNETNGRDFVLRAYAEAIKEHYRFFSYGDAMLIL